MKEVNEQMLNATLHELSRELRILLAMTHFNHSCFATGLVLCHSDITPMHNVQKEKEMEKMRGYLRGREEGRRSREEWR